jgi:hypothetical protein
LVLLYPRSVSCDNAQSNPWSWKKFYCLTLPTHWDSLRLCSRYNGKCFSVPTPLFIALNTTINRKNKNWKSFFSLLPLSKCWTEWCQLSVVALAVLTFKRTIRRQPFQKLIHQSLKCLKINCQVCLFPPSTTCQLHLWLLIFQALASILEAVYEAPSLSGGL